MTARLQQSQSTLKTGGEGGGDVYRATADHGRFYEEPGPSTKYSHRRVRTMVVFYEEPGPYETPHEKSGGACGQKFASDVINFSFNIGMGGRGEGQPMMHVFCYVIYRNT